MPRPRRLAAWHDAVEIGRVIRQFVEVLLSPSVNSEREHTQAHRPCALDKRCSKATVFAERPDVLMRSVVVCRVTGVAAQNQPLVDDNGGVASLCPVNEPSS